MNDNDTKRLSRLTAILTQLQTKRLLTATALAAKFSVSVRTIYRDIRALEQAGVPIITEDGKGYTLMEGYRVPPVMFTEAQANALITAEQLVLKNKDTSFIKEYSEAYQHRGWYEFVVVCHNKRCHFAEDTAACYHVWNYHSYGYIANSSVSFSHFFMLFFK